MDHASAIKQNSIILLHTQFKYAAMYFTMFAGFCSHVDENHIYTVLTVTTGPLRANIMLISPQWKWVW